MDNFKHFECDDLSFNLLMSQFAAFDHEVRALCDISLRTLQRYKREDDAPFAIKRLIWLRYAGLPASHGWQHMRIDKHGLLHDGLGRRLTAGEIRATYYQSALLRASREKVEELKAIIVGLEKELAAAAASTAANSPFYVHH